MQIMSIYKNDEFFIVEIKSDSSTHKVRKEFESEDQFIQYLEEIKPIMSDCEIEVSEQLWAPVINFLNRDE